MKNFKSITNSSTIQEIGYDDETRNLFIRFFNTGRYIYTKVPKDIYSEMCKAESVGKFFYGNIKGKFEFKKVEESK